MAEAITNMEINKKSKFQELERQIEDLESAREHDYKTLFDNSTISIWNEDFTLVFEELERLRTLNVSNIKKYLKKNPETLSTLLGKLKVNNVNGATLKLFKAENKEDFFNNIQNTFGKGASKVFTKLIIAIWKKKKAFISEVNYKTLKGVEFKALLSVRIPQTLLEQKSVPVTIQDISELKAVQSAKKQSILKLQQAQKLGRMGSWEWKWKTDEAYWSDEMYKIYGVKKGEFDPTSDNVRELIFEEDRSKVKNVIKKLFTERSMEPFEFRIVRTNNEIRHLSILGIEFIKDKVYGVTQDITDRKIIEDDLNEAQKLAKVGSWIFNTDVRKMEWSKVMFHIWGFDPSQGTPPYKVLLNHVHPDDMELWDSCIKRASSQGIPYDIEHRICLPDGTQKVIRCICEPVLGPNGTVIGLKGTGQDITEQKLIDEALIEAKEKAEESKNHLNSIIKNIGDPVFVKDDQSRLVIVNEAFCTLFGFERQEIIGKTLAEEVSPAEREAFLSIDKQLIIDGIENITEESLTIREGETQRISTRKTRFIDSNGNIFIVGVIHDITERFKTENLIKEAKERAEENEERFRILMLNLEAGVVVHAPDTSIVQCNYRASQILGFDEKYVQGKTGESMELKLVNLNASPLAIADYPVNKIAKTKESIKNQVIGLKREDKEDITWVTLNGFPVLSSTGEIKEIVMIFIDITAQRQNEKDKLKAKLLLDKTEKELSDAQALAKIGSWLVKPLTMKMEWSKEMYNIWGYKYGKDNPEYLSVIDRVHPDDREILKNAVDEATNSGAPYKIEYRICIPDHPQKTVRAICQPIMDDAGNVISLAGTNQDITQQKLLSRELISAKEKAEESDRLKSAFLANLSHEMRTPMNGILGFSELLRRKNISEEKRDIYLELIEKEGHRLLSFISNIVDISKIESNIIHIDNSRVNLNIIIKDIYSKYLLKLENSGVKLIIEMGLDDADSFIETDENKLVQIISNLLENAIKFTKQGTIEFGYSLYEKNLKFFVKDSGIGIEEEEQKNIFDRFTQGRREQTHNLGVGLGLSIVEGLIKLLNGEVWIDSQIGEGSTFFFTIPYKKIVSKTNLANTFNETTLESGDFTILIAEDDNLSFLYIQACLSDYDCTILRAINGKEAVELVHKNSNIDLVLMDINMPIMDGNEALEEIRKTNKELTIIAQTGLAMSGDKEKMLNAGFDDYISKPISTTILTNTINKHLKITT
ncbi:PAS domain-containing protein [Dokdonia sp. 4H-3-7-5]|uniref:PAS domain-containing protein n=1 Tax=Dokdonia sp. (strain 4H-3-7-5) TaxID=983548 RepID=UPI00020A78FB|nr:PAS domain-containing protein [Dokdonia sp. 4H-3-7-5]AEE20411.1 PAS/PAC sensor hybrid histidine kinase [Dokdonia sp. 4H-3-7-5]